MRALQYADELRRGYLVANVIPNVTFGSSATVDVDGAGGIGIIAMNAATDAGIDAARKHGVAALAVRNIGHTGRLGAFAERAADAGCLFIACGGGARERWRMVAPYGGSKAVLPTNRSVWVFREARRILSFWTARQAKLLAGGFMRHSVQVRR